MCACAPQAPTEAPTAEPTELTTEPTTEATTEATTVPITEPTEPPVLFRNPLNGMPLGAPYTGGAVAVVINNNRAALPQSGISAADLIYEFETEGDITRLLAVFSDLYMAGTIGPVRSTRTFFNNIAVSYDAPLIHCGGSKPGLSGHYDDNGIRVPDWKHINESYFPEYFFRDEERFESGQYSWEHTLFTTGNDLAKAVEDRGYRTVNENGTDFGLQFAENPELDGETAEQIIVNFRCGKKTTMTYDAHYGVYRAEQFGQEHLDAATGLGMTYQNVLVLYTKQWSKFDGTYDRSYYALQGSGTGHFACNGQIVPILWSRENLNDPFSYTLQDGTPITLAVGNTYVGIVSDKVTATYGELSN